MFSTSLSSSFLLCRPISWTVTPSMTGTSITYHSSLRVSAVIRSQPGISPIEVRLIAKYRLSSVATRRLVSSWEKEAIELPYFFALQRLHLPHQVLVLCSSWFDRGLVRAVPLRKFQVRSAKCESSACHHLLGISDWKSDLNKFV